jgi:hypothetical protein
MPTDALEKILRASRPARPIPPSKDLKNSRDPRALYPHQKIFEPLNTRCFGLMQADHVRSGFAERRPRPARRFTRHARPAEGTLRLAHKYQHVHSAGTSNLKSSVAAGPIFAATALPQKQFRRNTLRNRRRCTTFQARRAWWAFLQGQTWCAILSMRHAPPSIERSHDPGYRTVDV